jgi:hypothetical protein
MKKFVFWKLCDLLCEKLEPQYDDPFSLFRIPNGPITHTVRVSITLRYLAGGQPLDIALVHGVSHSEVFESLWKVVDAINQHPELAITFPTSHQQKVALVLVIVWEQLMASLYDTFYINYSTELGVGDRLVIFLLHKLNDTIFREIELRYLEM